MQRPLQESPWSTPFANRLRQYAAFAAEWPEAEPFNVLDDSLWAVVQGRASTDQYIDSRLPEFARYAAEPRAGGRAVDGMLITSSAFTQVIDATKRELRIPVMGPNETAFDRAIEGARRVGLLVTFQASEQALKLELQEMARARGATLGVVTSYVPGALDALQRRDATEHNAGQVIVDA